MRASSLWIQENLSATQLHMSDSLAFTIYAIRRSDITIRRAAVKKSNRFTSARLMKKLLEPENCLIRWKFFKLVLIAVFRQSYFVWVDYYYIFCLFNRWQADIIIQTNV